MNINYQPTHNMFRPTQIKGGKKMGRSKFTKEDAVRFHYLHNMEGKTLRKIAELYNTSHGVISNHLRKYNFQVKSRQYLVNDSFFEELDSPIKAYLLGWIYSDGCVFAYEEKNYYGFSIKLQKKDAYILEFFKEQLESDSIIHDEEYNGRVYSFLKIGSKKIYNDLLQYGLFPRKTHYLTYPFDLDMDHRAFILGIFEGDGSTSVPIKSTISPIISFTGTQALLNGIQDIICNKTGIPKNTKPKLRKNTTYELRFEGFNIVRTVRDWLYSWEPSLFLTRKKEILDQLDGKVKYGKNMIIFKCPNCNKFGQFEKRHIGALEKYTFGSKFCSLRCSGQFSRKYQLNNGQLTNEMKIAINENIVESKKAYLLTDSDGNFIPFNDTK